MGIALWQVGIFLTIVGSGHRLRHATASLWSLWTVAMVYTSPLFFIQFGTIVGAWVIAGRLRDTPLEWWWGGWPLWALEAESILKEKTELVPRGWGYISRYCASGDPYRMNFGCLGKRCSHSYRIEAGAWRVAPIDPNSNEFASRRVALLARVDSVIQQGLVQDPDHRWIAKLQKIATELRSDRAVRYAEREYRKYQTAVSRFHPKLDGMARHFRPVDTLSAISLLAIPALIAITFVSSAGQYDERDTKLMMMLALVALVPYVVQLILAAWWFFTRRVLIKHYFWPGGCLWGLFV